MANDRETIAEIEAILRDQIVLRRMGEDSFMEGFEDAARKVAALRSKDREDGAREIRERAAALCDEAAAYFVRTTGHYDRDQAAGSYRATAREIRALRPARAALPLHPTPKEDGNA